LWVVARRGRRHGRERIDRWGVVMERGPDGLPGGATASARRPAGFAPAGVVPRPPSPRRDMRRLPTRGGGGPSAARAARAGVTAVPGAAEAEAAAHHAVGGAHGAQASVAATLLAIARPGVRGGGAAPGGDPALLPASPPAGDEQHCGDGDGGSHRSP